MRYFGKHELISLSLLIGWFLIIAITTFLFMSMAELSYATTASKPVPKQVAKESEVKQVTQEYTGPVYSEEEIDLIALVTMAEAEGESELGKRLVIDTILNRVESDRFPNTVNEVVYQSGQFESMWNGRAERCEITDEIRELVREEISERIYDEILYFRADYYHNFGTPVVAVGNHYFSTY